MEWFAGPLGAVFILIVVSEAFEVMLLPRRVRRQLRLVRYFFRFSWRLWSSIARRIHSKTWKDSFLSLYGPLSMVVLLVFWAFGLIFGYALLQWAVEATLVERATFLRDISASAASFFTVPPSDLVRNTSLGRGLAVSESGLGLAFIAVTISYLPVLYQLFSRRETRVIQLDARAGSPPTGTALICRHCEHEAFTDLSDLLRDWEQWSAELVESHLSYPMLSYYRSQHDNQNWLAALAAILDACALILTGLKEVRTFSARMTFSVARLAVVELSRVFRLRVRGTDTYRLKPGEFEELTASLQNSGVEFTDPETAEQRLGAFRATYEPFLIALSEYFIAALPPWVPEHDTDNWQRSTRGRSAKQLVESAQKQPE